MKVTLTYEVQISNPKQTNPSIEEAVFWEYWNLNHDAIHKAVVYYEHVGDLYGNLYWGLDTEDNLVVDEQMDLWDTNEVTIYGTFDYEVEAVNG